MGGVSSLSELGSSGREPCFVRTGVRPLLTQFEGAPVGLGLKQLSVGATLAGSFVNCGTRAPNGSFVNHQQLFGGVCKTRGLRTTNVSFPLSSSSPLPYSPLGREFILQKIPLCFSRDGEFWGKSEMSV